MSILPPRALALATAVAALAIVIAGCSDAPLKSRQSSSAAPQPSTVGSGSPAPDATSTGVEVAAPAQAYIDAVNSGDLDALVAAFAPDGQVRDVSRPIVGRDAIRTWAQDEVIGGRLEVISVTATPEGQDLLVQWAPAGSDGWRAHYRFDMSETHILLADLQYA